MEERLSRTTRTSGDTPSKSGLQLYKTFDDVIFKVAEGISGDSDLRKLLLELGVKTPDIDQALKTNLAADVKTRHGNQMMLQNWAMTVKPLERLPTLRAALKKAGLGKLEETCLPSTLPTETNDSVINQLMNGSCLRLSHGSFAAYFIALETLGKDVMRKGSVVGETLGVWKPIDASTSSSHAAMSSLSTWQKLPSSAIENVDLDDDSYRRMSAIGASQSKVRKGSVIDKTLGHWKTTDASISSSHLAAIGLFTLQNLRYLDIRYVDLDDDFYKGMCAASSQSKIEEFTHKMRSMAPLGPDASLHYARGLFSMPNLRSLDLTRLNLSDEFYSCMATEGSKSKVQRLILKNVSMTRRILHTFLSLPCLQSLTLRGIHNFDKNDKEMLTSQSISVKELSVDCMDVTALWKLGLHTSCTRVQKLTLNRTYKGNVSSEIVTMAGSPFHHLTHLLITGHRGTLDSESFSYAVITSCPQLTKLSLVSIDLRNEQATEIIQSMKTHPHLLSLELLRCQTDMGLDALIAEVNREGKLTVTVMHSWVSQQSKDMPSVTAKKTSPSLHMSSSDDLVGATAGIQIHEDETDTQEEEDEEKKKEVEEDYYSATENFPYETDEYNVPPLKMECHKSVGVEGDKLQLDSFGIELEIPPGAIDSEMPQDISLRVLTDTPNFGDNKEEMSVCFGVQCLAPDDLVLKLPVTYTIPHCAVITRYSSVDAVLYTGEGECTPDAVVKEQILLTRTGIPSCTITKGVLKLKMNHFSWAKIKLRIKNFFFRGKRMCCLPFRKKNLPLQKAPVILRTHLYEDIPGNRELIKSQEGELEFMPVHPELQVQINLAEVDLTMTCYIEETVIGGPAVVSFERLNSGNRICEPFKLDFKNQPDFVVVSMKVGQTEKLKVNLTFSLEFRTSRKRGSDSPHDQERLKRASSSQISQTSHRTEEENPDSNKESKVDDALPAGQKDFDDILKIVAKKIRKHDKIDDLGKALGFHPADIHGYIATNMRDQNLSYMGTLFMLRDWLQKQTKDTESKALKTALKMAGQIHLADDLFGSK